MFFMGIVRTGGNEDLGSRSGWDDFRIRATTHWQILIFLLSIQGYLYPRSLRQSRLKHLIVRNINRGRSSIERLQKSEGMGDKPILH